MPHNKQSTRPRFVSDEVPLYYQLQTILMHRIHSGELRPGDQIPTEAELGKDYGVSRITVRQALQNLEIQGFVRREVGRGTFVSERPSFSGTIQLEGSIEDLISLALATSVKVLKISTVRASPGEAKSLGLEAGDRLVKCVRLRYHHKEPYSHIVNIVPYEIGSRLTRSDWKGSVSKALQSKLKIPLLKAQQTIRASLADSELASKLATPIGAPLLLVDRLVSSKHGRGVELVQTHYRSDIFSFTVHLSRTHSQSDWAFKTNSAAAK